jgi:hypothetical protein
MKLRLITILLAAGLIAACGSEEEAKPTDTPPVEKPAGDMEKPPAEEPPAETPPAAVDKSAEAMGLIEQAKTLIGQKKFTEAQGLIDKLIGLKDNLPAGVQAKIEDLLEEYGLAKATGGLKISGR